MTSPPASAIAALDSFWVWIDGDNKSVPRIAIILRVEPDGSWLEVVYGQGRRDVSFKDVCVRPGTADGDGIGVSKPTYFRVTNVVMVRPVRLIERIGSCPAMLFPDFLDLADEARIGGLINDQR